MALILSQFLDSYDAADGRYKDCWNVDTPQYAMDGTPLIANGVQVVYTKEIRSIDQPGCYEYEGGRLVKYEILPGDMATNYDDVPFYRYADVLLKKAECLLRLGGYKGETEQDAADLVTQVRARNFKSNPAKAVRTVAQLKGGKDYDVEHLIALLKGFKERYPNLELIMEPGSAFAWQTGFLLTTVVDIVENHGIKTAIIDASFTCHMPDCLEMPYKPAIRFATDAVEGKPTYRIGGNSCLSGDYMGDWSFDKPLAIGDKLIFEDMIHYTIVKTNMFNGIPHPSLALWSKDDQLVMYRTFGYEDYKNRMD